jgi:hypothetical protein|tara:strand:+ start:27247 stop:27693 length:447 start_codon:yes stop_codon:yes gene_type:complete
MAKQVIGIGTTANDGTGDPIRSAFDKTNDNFTELYDGAGVADDSITYSKLADEFTTIDALTAAATVDIDFADAQVYTLTITEATALTFSNVSTGMVKDIIVTGDFALTLPTSLKEISGTYDGTVSNLIQVVSTNGATEQWGSISQEAV